MVRGSLFGRAAWLAAALVATLALACAAPQARAIAQEGGAIEVVDTGGKGVVAADEFAADPELEPEAQASVSYRTHVQTHGWQGWRADGQVAGTSGESKHLEAIDLRVEGASGGIEYRTHVQTHGWQGWRADGETSGTSGESKRLEAIEIRLTGELAETHDVWYRVHAQTFGWMGWAKDGERAGTATMGKRLEAIQVVLVAKGGAAPGDTFGGVTADHAAAYETRLVQYRTHVQTHGWQEWSYDGQTSGTSGQSKRLEALEIKIADPPCAGGVEYRTHVQTYGWQG